jgi:hypothetical protein
LLAAGAAAVLVLSVPTTLFEHLSTASGLSDLLPFLAPPLGIWARTGLAAMLALVAAAIVCVHRLSDRMEPDQDIASSSGWDALVRLVRGETDNEGLPSEDMLTRRRRDRHPDAPPRPPIFASRDLPSLQARAPDAVEKPDDAAPMVAPAETSISSIRAPEPVPLALSSAMDLLPRSPEPMSEAEIARTIAALTSREGQAPVEDIAPIPSAGPVSAQAAYRPVLAPALAVDLPLIEDADIAGLAARFERGIAKREVVLDAEEAQNSLDSRIAFVQPDPAVRTALRAIRPIELVARPTPFAIDQTSDASMMRVDADVEAALNSALSTLRKLTEQGRR